MCPNCGQPGTRAIYVGLPVWVCLFEDCHTGWGFWSWLPVVFGFNGALMSYEGSYWRALWAWLRGAP